MILCLSVSHKDASLPLLESLTFKDEGNILKKISSIISIQECILVQTCHRVEIYCVTNRDVKDAAQYLVRFWSKEVGISSDIIESVLRIHHGKEAILHLFYVASGMESMVIGEDQILGQIRKAYVKAKKLGTAGLILEKVFMKAVNVGRRIRTETKINEGSVSISSVAVDLAVKKLESLEDKAILVIGAGEAGSIVAETLHEKGAKRLFIANRTYRRGLQLAHKVSGTPIKFNELMDVLQNVDLVFAAVSTDKPVLGAKELEPALKQRWDRVLFIIDLSQPRFFEEKVKSVENVVLKNIDDLKEIVEENIAKRVNEREKAEKIILDELRLFERQLARILAEPLISEICNKMNGIREKELKRAIGKMKEQDKKKKTIIERFSRELMERMLQVPLEKVRQAVLDNDNELVSAVEKLFEVKGERKGE